jgi:hypothetical protein
MKREIWKIKKILKAIPALQTADKARIGHPDPGARCAWPE